MTRACYIAVCAECPPLLSGVGSLSCDYGSAVVTFLEVLPVMSVHLASSPGHRNIVAVNDCATSVQGCQVVCCSNVNVLLSCVIQSSHVADVPA